MTDSRIQILAKQEESWGRLVVQMFLFFFFGLVVLAYHIHTQPYVSPSALIYIGLASLIMNCAFCYHQYICTRYLRIVRESQQREDS